MAWLGVRGACSGNCSWTVETRGQASVGADPAEMNKGGGAAVAALHLIALTRKFGRPKGSIGFMPRPDVIEVAGNSKGPSTA